MIILKPFTREDKTFNNMKAKIQVLQNLASERLDEDLCTTTDRG